MKLKFDAKKCVGCEICTMACSLVHTGETGLWPGRIKIERNYPSLQAPLLKGFYCRQCPKPKCAEACPEQAYTREGDLVVFDADKCTGCGLCVPACPFHAVWLDQASGKVFKCDTCGGDPTCMRVCPHDALKWE